ncbi:hypothetical protein VTN77DRAFT_8719 [Rasamsonia byssochlamydoides]|uniref:uncharacterized protein n=1 Tax=Rasamsonia byssochlamydoides TaxID=89139 RepID=UPI0037435F88
MLLDGDEAGSYKSIRSQREHQAEHTKPLIQPSLLGLSSEDTMTMASTHSCQPVVTRQVSSDLLIDNSDADQRTPNGSATAISTGNLQPNSSGSFSPASHSSRLPVLHRFTIDDQILAERENELAKSRSSIGPQSTYDTHVHDTTPQPSPELLFRSRDHYSESNLTNSSDGIIHRAQSFASNQTGSGWLPQSEQEGEATYFFATPNGRSTSIQDTETRPMPAAHEIARTRAEWDLYAGSACQKRTSPPIFFGQTLSQNSQIGVDEVQTPSRLVEQRSQSIGRSQQEQSELDMHIPQRFTHDPSVPDSRNPTRQSSRHTNANVYDDNRKFTTNIHCHANLTRSFAHVGRSRTTISPLIHSSGRDIGAGRQQTTTTQTAGEQAESSSRLPSASFRFPAYWTPQHEQRHTSAAAAAIAASSSPKKKMQPSPVPHPSSSSPSSLSFSRRYILTEKKAQDSFPHRK